MHPDGGAGARLANLEVEDLDTRGLLLVRRAQDVHHDEGRGLTSLCHLERHLHLRRDRQALKGGSAIAQPSIDPAPACP